MVLTPTFFTFKWPVLTDANTRKKNSPKKFILYLENN